MNFKTHEMLMKILDYAEKSYDPDMFGDIELEYQDIIKQAKNFHEKIQKIFKELNLKL